MDPPSQSGTSPGRRGIHKGARPLIMNETLNKAIELLREISRSSEDFANLDPISIGDILYEYWSDHGLTQEDSAFLDKLYKSAHE